MIHIKVARTFDAPKMGFAAALLEL